MDSFQLILLENIHIYLLKVLIMQNGVLLMSSVSVFTNSNNVKAKQNERSKINFMLIVSKNSNKVDFVFCFKWVTATTS